MSHFRFSRMLAATLAVAAPMVLAPVAMAHEVEAGGLKIVHPWTYEPAEGAKSAVVSMTIHNTGALADRLLAAASPFSAGAELRQGNEPEQPSGPIDIPAGETVKLRAGGPHVTLIGVSEPLAGYETFPLSLTFETAGKVDIEVMVEERN